MRNKKKLAVFGIVALLMVGAGAYAYFTNDGSGTGTATVGTSDDIEITSDTNATDLYPGGPAENLTVHVYNPGDGNQYVNEITGVVEDEGLCDGDWFTVAPITYEENINPNSSGPDEVTAITFNDNDADQNACKDAEIDITWSSN